jgi:hypothetical protein
MGIGHAWRELKHGSTTVGLPGDTSPEIGSQTAWRGLETSPQQRQSATLDETDVDENTLS